MYDEILLTTSGCLQSPDPQCPVFWPMLDVGPDKRPNLQFDESIYNHSCSFIFMLRPHAVCFRQVERTCNCHQLLVTTCYKLVKKAWVHQKRLTAYPPAYYKLSRSLLSCPPATKLSHFARYGFEGSRPGGSIIDMDFFEENTPNQPTFENGYVTTFRNCHYKAWHSHRLAKHLLQGSHPACFHPITGLGSFPQGTCIVDGYDLILTALHVAPLRDLKCISTCHQTRRKAQLFSFSPCHSSKGTSPGEIWREQYENNIQKQDWQVSPHLWDDIWSRWRANFAVVCT